MKTISNIFLLTILAAVAMMSCVKDNGNYDYVETSSLSVEFPQDWWLVQQFMDLRIVPKITVTGGDKSEADFDYMWIINQAEYASTQYNDTLSYEKIFDRTIGQPPLEYELMLHITDRETGMRYFNSTYVKVENSSSTGLMVLSNVDGYADIAFINSFGDCIESIYQARNGHHVGRNPIYINHVARDIYGQNKSTPAVYILCEDENGGMVASEDDFEEVIPISSMFVFQPEVMKPQFIYHPTLSIYRPFINNGKLHVQDTGDGGYPMISPPSLGDYDLYPIAFGSGYNDMKFYDQKNKRFMFTSTLQDQRLVAFGTGKWNETDPFNPGNVGMTMLTANYELEGWTPMDGRAVMEDSNGDRYLMGFSIGSGSGENVSPQFMNLASIHPGFNTSPCYALTSNGTFCYYANGNVIRCIGTRANELMNHQVTLELPAGSKIDYMECSQGSQLWIAASDGSATANSGSVWIFDFSSDGSLTQKGVYRNICGKVVDFDFKQL